MERGMNPPEAALVSPVEDQWPVEPPMLSPLDLLTWIGEGKRRIAAITLGVGVVAVGLVLLLSPVFTAQTTLMPPNTQQQGGAMAALASLGALGSLAGSLSQKTPDEQYVALLKSDTVQRALADRFGLYERWKVDYYEQMRKTFASYVRIASDKKSGLITIEVDDRDPQFAASLANGYPDEIGRLLDRLAVSEAKSRRIFFEQQLKETKDHLVAAELGLLKVQETYGVIVLDKQAEALIGGAASLRAQITEREVMLNVLRKSATEKNPDVQRLSAEVAALRSQLARMESSSSGDKPSVFDMPVNKLTGGGVEYIRALRELKLQEALLEAMIRQYEMAKLDEAKEGPALQQVDVAKAPDYKSKPARALIVLAAMLVAALAVSVWTIWRRYRDYVRDTDPETARAWTRTRQAWRWRR